MVLYMAKLNNNGENFIGSFEVTVVPLRPTFGVEGEAHFLAVPCAGHSAASKLFTGSGLGDATEETLATLVHGRYEEHTHQTCSRNPLARSRSALAARDPAVCSNFVTGHGPK
jgi:hypothetical protein